MPNKTPMTKPTSKLALTRRELARQALAGTAGLLGATGVLLAALPARSQGIDPMPAAPPPLSDAKPTQNPTPMPNTPVTEGQLLTQLVPVAAGYTLSDTQAKEAALQLKDYPGGFSKARAYALPDDIGPAFAADAPTRKERAK